MHVHIHTHIYTHILLCVCMYLYFFKLTKLNSVGRCLEISKEVRNNFTD